MIRIIVLFLIALNLGIAFPSAGYAQDSRERDLDRRERELNRRERDEIRHERDEIRRERGSSRRGRSHNSCREDCLAESRRCNRVRGGGINGCGIQRVQCLSNC
jgi:hypothetical protein